MVPPHAGAFTWEKLGPPLADDDLACLNGLPSADLYPQPFAGPGGMLPGRAGCFF